MGSFSSAVWADTFPQQKTRKPRDVALIILMPRSGFMG
jgi:hypothetical protein